MRTIGLGVVFAMAMASGASAQLVGYSVNPQTGLVTTFSCFENGDPDCFRFRTELGIIDASFSTGSSEAITLAPTGELVVGNPVTGDVALNWINLPELEVVASLPLIADIDVVFDLAFGPDGALWIVASTNGASGRSLFVVDQVSGVATEVWNFGEEISSIAFVEDRLFAAGGTKLLELHVETGVAREIQDFYYPGPYPWPVLIFTSLASCDGQLWSLSYSPPYPPGPHTVLMLGTHDLETGDQDVLVNEFDLVLGNGDPRWTLDLVDSPEQQLPAVPVAGGYGLAIMAVLIGLAGVLIARRVL